MITLLFGHHHNPYLYIILITDHIVMQSVLFHGQMMYTTVQDALILNELKHHHSIGATNTHILHWFQVIQSFRNITIVML